MKSGVYGIHQRFALMLWENSRVLDPANRSTVSGLKKKRKTLSYTVIWRTYKKNSRPFWFRRNFVISIWPPSPVLRTEEASWADGTPRRNRCGNRGHRWSWKKKRNASVNTDHGLAKADKRYNMTSRESHWSHLSRQPPEWPFRL